MNNPVTEVRAFVTAALLDPVPREHLQSAEELVQRRWISSVTLAMGSFLLAITLRLPPGDPAFYATTLALSATWIVGGMISGKIYLGNSNTRAGTSSGRGVLQAVIIGVVLLGVFLGGAMLVAPVAILRNPLRGLLMYADLGILPLVTALTVLVAIGEELFFRGALWAAVGGRQALLVTTLIYALTTIPSGLPLMVFAAALVGFVAGAHRRVTGGVLGPIIIHLIWSLGMLLLLPFIVGQ